MTPLNLAFSFCVFASDLFWSNVAQHAKKFDKNILKIWKLEFFFDFSLGMLQETTMRPIFGEDLVDHLNACKRKIAKPLALSIMSLLDGGLTDEGLFRIPTKQIKLDKVKAFMDTNTPLTHVLQVKYLNYRVSQQVSDSKILILRFSYAKPCCLLANLRLSFKNKPLGENALIHSKNCPKKSYFTRSTYNTNSLQSNNKCTHCTNLHALI